MTENELINTAVSGFTPYQFNPQSLQVMPTGFNQVATRAEKRISDTQKRVQDLVALDPTNPLAALLTIMGKQREHGIRDELSILRGQEFKKDRASKYRKKILADIKALDYGDALGIYAREKHGSDIDATLNDPDLMEGLEKIATRQKEMSLKDKGALLVKVAQLMTEVETYDRGFGDKKDPYTKMLMDEKRRYIQAVYAALGTQHNMSPSEIDAKVDAINSSAPQVKGTATHAGTTKKTETPVDPVDIAKEALLGNVKKPIHKTGKKRVVAEHDPVVPAKVAPPETGVKKMFEDFKSHVDDQANDINRSIREGTFWEKTKKNIGSTVDKLFGEEQLPEGWVVDHVPLKQTGKKKKVGDPLNRREVYFHSDTGKYVGQRDGKNGNFKWFVGDVRNGVQKSFDTKEEAFAFAQTYQPKVPKEIERVDLTGTDSTGSVDLVTGSDTRPSNAYLEGLREQYGQEKYDQMMAKADRIAMLKGKKIGVTGTIVEPTPPAKQDFRTEYEKSTKPWQRTWYGGYIDKGIGKVLELYGHVMNKLQPEVEAIKDVKTLYEAGAEKVGKDVWPLVVDMAEKIYDFAGSIDTIDDAEGAAINEIRNGEGKNNAKGNDDASSVSGGNAGGVTNTIPSNKKHHKSYGGFAGYNPVATSVDQFMTNPFVEAMVTAESNGKERAIGYKLVEAKDANGKTIMKANGQPKLVYAKDKNGKKIPASFGIMQVTINTALSTEAGKELMRGLDPNNKDDRKEIVEILFDPYNNLKIGTEYANRLRTQLEGNKYASKFSPIDFDKAVSAAYNYKGENFAKDVLDKYKPKSMKDLLHRAYIPAETRRQIRVVERQLRKAGR